MCSQNNKVKFFLMIDTKTKLVNVLTLLVIPSIPQGAVQPGRIVQKIRYICNQFVLLKLSAGVSEH